MEIQHVKTAQLFFPAYAGMIPGDRCIYLVNLSFSRIRGDDPATDGVQNIQLKFVIEPIFMCK